ncbi:MAG: hypothetical protein QNJ72_21645 [Pleurocapsa sp. MO_226.B13]|nr:hypothetical protein [Pleurocapsa sp. MO_226.B13]
MFRLSFFCVVLRWDGLEIAVKSKAMGYDGRSNLKRSRSFDRISDPREINLCLQKDFRNIHPLSIWFAKFYPKLILEKSY